MHTDAQPSQAVFERYAMSARSSLRGRIPGQAAMTEVLAAYASSVPRSRLGRLIGQHPLSPEHRPLYRAAIGESLVGDMLDTLGTRWDVLHVVPLDGAKDIDHLVIGPPGVFAIVTENYPGSEVRVDGDALTVGGRQFEEIACARQLGDQASRLLSAAAGRPVTVSPMLVIVSPTRLSLRRPPAGVTEVASKHHLERLHRTLGGAEVASISDAAERDTTWQAAPAPVQDVQQLSRDFGALRRKVDEATQLRVLWGVVGFAIVAGVLLLTASMLMQHLLHR
jgi:hypothetical protein